MRRWRPQLHSAFTAAVEVMALVLLATLFGRIMYGLYQNISADRAVVQAIPAVAVVSVWLFFMNRTRARETYDAEPESGADQEGFGARTVRLDRQRPPRAAAETFDERFDLHRDLEEPR
jgi:hypothetical protein